jgi:hypothetical protein
LSNQRDLGSASLIRPEIVHVAMPAFMDNPSDTATWAGPGGLLPCTPAGRLELTVVHPALGVCVVTVTGELDILTAPLPDACVGE